MTAAWMLYAILVASLAALGAAAIDRLFAIWRLPRRYLWLSAMVIAAVAPLVAATRNAPSLLAPPSLERQTAGAVALSPPVTSVTPARIPRGVLVMRALRNADRPARVLWIATSTLALVALLGALVLLRKRRASWTSATVDGHTTWIAPDVGPAVVGLMRPRIVLPAWALHLGDRDRGLVLRHESEHIRAGDPQLLLFASLLLVAMPWNPALWWMTRRMRLAMEIDCDARVLRGTDAIHEYGLLLLTVCERRSHTLPLVASLTEQRGLLERRILAMTTPRPGYPRLVSMALGLVACAAGIAIAQAPAPQGGDAAGSAATRDTLGVQTRDMIAKLVRERYPAVHQGASPINRITFVLDARGNYVTSTAWTDSAMQLRATPTTTAAGGSASSGAATRSYESVRMVLGGGVPGGDGSRTRDASARRQGAGGASDFGAYGFPKITRDEVMATQSAMSRAPSALSVFVIRLKK